MCYADPETSHGRGNRILLCPARQLAAAEAHSCINTPWRSSAIRWRASRPRSSDARSPARIVWGTADTIFSSASPDYLDRTFGNSRGVRRVPGAKLFFPEELPGTIAEEARRLWGIA